MAVELNTEEDLNWLNEVERGLGTGNESLSELGDTPEWDSHFLELFERVWNADTDRNLLEFSPSQVPEMVKQNLRDAILGGSLFSDIESIPSDQRQQLRNFMVEQLEDDNWNIDGIANRLQDLDTSLSDDRAELIARTEVASTVNSAREEGYKERGQEDGLFYWTGALDGRQTEACEWLIRKTNPHRGGEPVSLERLKELIEEAPTHDPDMQDGIARPDDFVVHPNERKTWVRHVE